MKTQRKWQKCALINFGITSYVTFVLGLIIALVIASHGILGVFYFTVVDQIVTTPAVRPNIIYSVHLDTSVSIPVGLEAKYKKQSPSNYTDNTFPDDLITEIEQMSFRSVARTQGLVLVGIFCRAEDKGHRNLHRVTSHHLAPPGVMLRFVICSLSSDTSRQKALEAEASLHRDLLLLECEENMDGGKSPLFFRTVARKYPHYHFYAKSDIDTYNLYFNLALALDAAPKCGLYMGQYRHYVTKYNVGHLYVLSKDLVLKIQNCRHGCPDPNNYEDMVIGQYVNQLAQDTIQWGSWGSRHVVYGADGTLLGDSKRRGGPPLRNLFTPWVILVHGVKAEHWMNATQYFRDVLSADTLRASTKENFVEGETTHYWDMNCVLHRRRNVP